MPLGEFGGSLSCSAVLWIHIHCVYLLWICSTFGRGRWRREGQEEEFKRKEIRVMKRRKMEKGEWREKEKAAKGGKGIDTLSWGDVGAIGAWQRTQHWAWNAGHRESQSLWFEPSNASNCLLLSSWTRLGHHLEGGWNHGNPLVSGVDVTRTKGWFRRGRQFCFTPQIILIVLCFLVLLANIWQHETTNGF